MFTFIKTQAALIAGSVADFGLTFLLVNVFDCFYVSATVAGNIVGACAQFGLSRYWVFKTAQSGLSLQAGRFILVWLGHLLLSAAGTYLFTRYGGYHYLLSKTIVSTLLGVSYTYLLKRYFVFA